MKPQESYSTVKSVRIQIDIPDIPPVRSVIGMLRSAIMSNCARSRYRCEPDWKKVDNNGNPLAFEVEPAAVEIVRDVVCRVLSKPGLLRNKKPSYQLVDSEGVLRIRSALANGFLHCDQKHDFEIV